MKKILLTIVVLGFVSGCTVIRNEAGYPGGNAGKIADKTFYVARDQEQRVDRFFIALALIAPLAEATSESAQDAAATARHINALYSSILKMDAALKASGCSFSGRFAKFSDGANGVGPENADCAFTQTTNTEFTFESLAFDASRNLFRLTRQSADNLNLRSRLSALSGLDPLNLLSRVWSARRLVPIMMEYLATYRDLSIIFADSLAAHCAALADRPAGCGTLLKTMANNFQNPTITSATITSEYQPIRRALRQSLDLADLPAMKDWSLSPAHVAAILVHIDSACAELYREQQSEDNTSAIVNCGKPVDGNPTQADFANTPRAEFAILKGVTDVFN